jgi:Apea-like HEPN
MKVSVRKTNVNRLLRLAQSETSPEDLPLTRSRSFGRSGQAFHFIDQEVDEFEAVVKDILDIPEWSLKFSERYVEQSLIELLVRLRQDPVHERSKELFSALEADLDAYQDEQVVCVPAEYINVPDDGFTVGNVLFIRITKANIDATLYPLSAVQDSEVRVVRPADVLKDVGGKTCALYKVVAEPDRAKERAILEARSSVDLMRYSAPLIDGFRFGSAAALEHDVKYRNSNVIAFAADGKWKNYSQSGGRLTSFTYNPAMDGQLDEIGFSHMSKALMEDPDTRTDLESALIRALHWLGDGHSQPAVENQLLSLVTAMETLFTKESDDPIALSIAESMAFVLADTLDGRRFVKGFVKRMYTTRSKISHGKQRQITDADLVSFRLYVTLAVHHCILRADEFGSLDGLLNWIEDERLRPATCPS